MSFILQMQKLDPAALRARIAAATRADVSRALSRDIPSDDDLPALFSEAAVPFLEELAQRCAAVTERRFGKVMNLYTPLYLSNECVNKCTYCGFSHDLEIERISLTVEQVVAEADLLYAEGFRHLLLVAGETRKHVGMPYLLDVVRALRDKWDSLAIEIQPLNLEEYRALVEAGVDGLAIYQETYDPLRYSECHPKGPKRNFANRLDAIERGGAAGMRSLGIAALLGLNDWRFEAVMVALHGRYLAKKYWQSKIAVSFPRIRDAASCYRPEYLVTDRDLAQMIFAMRLVLPDAELVLSTREPARLRDRMIGLGITRMSAGSKTQPGGYTSPENGGEQFAVSDERSHAEVAAVITARGYEPVWKDFDREFQHAAG